MLTLFTFLSNILSPLPGIPEVNFKIDGLRRALCYFIASWLLGLHA